MTINFDKVIERRNTNCSKYDGMAASFGRNNLLPLWIADMDFPVPEAVTEAIKRRAEHPIYGYNIFPQGYYEAFCAWEKKRHNWDVDPAWVWHTPGVLTALSTAILTFTKEGDGVLIQPPVYFPFRSTIEALGRKVIDNQLRYEDGRFTMDFEDLAQKAAQAKLFVFCSPHNPSGRVWTKEELMRVHDICRKNELLVFSDEIHSDIVYKQHSHTVFAQLSDWALHHSIVAMAPSKTFNLAGLEMSHITIANDELRKQFQYYERFGLHVANGNSFGLGAAQAAYEHGEDWYQALLSYLKENLDYLDGALKARVPQVKLVYPEATYIPILDMQTLGMEPERSSISYGTRSARRSTQAQPSAQAASGLCASTLPHRERILSCSSKSLHARWRHGNEICGKAPPVPADHLCNASVGVHGDSVDIRAAGADAAGAFVPAKRCGCGAAGTLCSSARRKLAARKIRPGAASGAGAHWRGALQLPLFLCAGPYISDRYGHFVRCRTAYDSSARSYFPE